jgi:hypothetical protein
MWGFGVSEKRTLDMGAIVMLENSGYRSRLQNTIVFNRRNRVHAYMNHAFKQKKKKTTVAVEHPVSTAAGGGGVRGRQMATGLTMTG